MREQMMQAEDDEEIKRQRELNEKKKTDAK